jgi:hypothetical protein
LFEPGAGLFAESIGGDALGFELSRFRSGRRVEGAPLLPDEFFGSDRAVWLSDAAPDSGSLGTELLAAESLLGEELVEGSGDFNPASSASFFRKLRRERMDPGGASFAESEASEPLGAGSSAADSLGPGGFCPAGPA